MTSTATAKEQYWRDGYAVVRGVYSDSEIQSFRTEAERLWNLEGLDDDLNLRTEFRRDADGRQVFDRLDPVLDISAVLTGAARHPELQAAMAEILGGAAQLLKCKLIRKEPGVGGYAVHQDFLYWTWLDTAPDALCSVAINLFPCDEQSGGIGFYSGAHRELIPGPVDNPAGDCDPARLDRADVVFPELDAGDVLIFHSLAPHYSGRNDSDRPRTVLLPSYCVTDEAALYQRYYRREVVRRCQDMVGFERYFERNDILV